jgi:tRNA modification GTPase
VEDVAKRIPERGEAGEVVTNERHRECLVRAADALERCVDGIHSSGIPLSILASDIKEGLTALDEIVGKTYTEDILGRIFSKFCVGK